MPIYNITNVTDATGVLETFQEINKLSDNVLGNGWSIVIFILILLLALYATRDFRKALVTSGAVNFIISGIFLFSAGLIGIWLPIAYIASLVLGVILLQDKDTGT